MHLHVENQKPSLALLFASICGLATGCSVSDTVDGAGGNGSGPGSGVGMARGATGATTGFMAQGGATTGQMGPPKSCQAVDLLFVIDNSPSMGPYQEQLAEAFPGFVDAMYDKLPSTVNLHVGITTTSFFSGSCGEATTNCKSAETPETILAHYTKPTDGSTMTNGEQGRLFQHQGKPYFEVDISNPDRAPLKAWFTEAATAAGETGCSFEMATAGAAYAAHPANAATNAGFIRDEDAVLLVIFLSDEPDKSPEALGTYKDMLTSAKTKCGGDKCILTAALVDSCLKPVNDTLYQFMNAFGEPAIMGDIDEPGQYKEVVGGALAQVIKSTCDEIAVPK